MSDEVQRWDGTYKRARINSKDTLGFDLKQLRELVEKTKDFPDEASVTVEGLTKASYRGEGQYYVKVLNIEAEEGTGAR